MKKGAEKKWNILQRMGVLSSTEDFQEFLQEQDIVIENE